MSLHSIGEAISWPVGGIQKPMTSTCPSPAYENANVWIFEMYKKIKKYVFRTYVITFNRWSCFVASWRQPKTYDLNISLTCLWKRQRLNLRMYNKTKKVCISDICHYIQSVKLLRGQLAAAKNLRPQHFPHVLMKTPTLESARCTRKWIKCARGDVTHTNALIHCAHNTNIENIKNI